MGLARRSYRRFAAPGPTTWRNTSTMFACFNSANATLLSIMLVRKNEAARAANPIERRLQCMSCTAPPTMARNNDPATYAERAPCETLKRRFSRSPPRRTTNWEMTQTITTTMTAALTENSVSALRKGRNASEECAFWPGGPTLKSTAITSATTAITMHHANPIQDPASSAETEPAKMNSASSTVVAMRTTPAKYKRAGFGM